MQIRGRAHPLRAGNGDVEIEVKSTTIEVIFIASKSG